MIHTTAKTSVHHHLYHADSRDKPWFIADNMTASLRNGKEDFAGSKNVFLNTEIILWQRIRTNPIACFQCFPPWGNYRVLWIYIKIATATSVP